LVNEVILLNGNSYALRLRIPVYAHDPA
jgi:hypothetical protein